MELLYLRASREPSRMMAGVAVVLLNGNSVFFANDMAFRR
jgi:hypothetical protein